MYYKGARYRNYINGELKKRLREAEGCPRQGEGIRASRLNEERPDDLKRGGNNFDYLRENEAEAPYSENFGRYMSETDESDLAEYERAREEMAEEPVSDGLGGYVPNGTAPEIYEGDRSRLQRITYDGVYNREIRLMHELYGGINAFLYPIVAEVINGREFAGSDIYDYDVPVRGGRGGGTIKDSEIDRDNLNRMVTEVYNRAVMFSDDIDEINNDDNTMLAGSSREELLRAAIESLILTEIFLSRRPFYRNTAEAYRFFEGRYDGVNPLY